MTRPLRVALIGNFTPPHSTENHVARAFRSHRHRVAALQENSPATWRFLTSARLDADLVLWTRTAWDWTRHGLTPEQARDMQVAALERLHALGVPVIGYHLDRWWGLAREHEVHTEPYFRCVDLLITADGGHDAEWEQAGVAHAWLPPAVSAAEARPGARRSGYTSDVAFVGSWQGGYHQEWPHRAELVTWLRDIYGPRVRFWPAPGRAAIRGAALRDLYASVKVLVGDSCLAGGATHYCSDRVSETIGRGGFLVHPHVEGVTDGTHYTAGVHLATWPLGDWDALRDTIDGALADGVGRTAIARAGRAHVLEHHTYERRVEQLVALARERELL